MFRNPEFSLGWLGAPGAVELHVEARSDDVVVIPDAAFLFNAEFQRAGRDLVLTGEDGRRLVVDDYFAHDKRPALASRDGATVSAVAIEAIVKNTTPEQYAQAGAPESARSPIGRVEKVTGSAFVIRNGVAVELNVGDVVFKGDVVQTRSGSTLGIGFVDGTAFNLAANARMVLNEMVFDPNGTSNSALLTLIQGTISFAAGQVAKTGDMKVETPVATMGIRGTMVLVEIAADNGPTKFHVLREPDGTVGKVEIYSKTDSSLIATITNPDRKVEVTPPAPGVNMAPVVVETAKTTAEQQIAQAVVQQVASVQASFQSNPLTVGPQAPTEAKPTVEPKGDAPQTNPNTAATSGGSSGSIDIVSSVTQATTEQPSTPPPPPPLPLTTIPVGTVQIVPTTTRA